MARRTTLEIQIDTIEDGVTERPGIVTSTEEQVPDSVGEGDCLSVISEGDGSSSTANGKSDDFAGGLASLDVRGHEAAVREFGS